MIITRNLLSKIQLLVFLKPFFFLKIKIKSASLLGFTIPQINFSSFSGGIEKAIMVRFWIKHYLKFVNKTFFKIILQEFRHFQYCEYPLSFSKFFFLEKLKKLIKLILLVQKGHIKPSTRKMILKIEMIMNWVRCQ